MSAGGSMSGDDDLLSLLDLLDEVAADVDRDAASAAPAIARTPSDVDDDALALFDVPPPHRDYWWGMPEFIMNDCTPYFTVSVHFTSWDSVVEFAEQNNVTVTRRTKSVWWNAGEVEQVKDWCYAEE